MQRLVEPPGSLLPRRVLRQGHQQVPARAPERLPEGSHGVGKEVLSRLALRGRAGRVGHGPLEELSIFDLAGKPFVVVGQENQREG